MPTKQAPRRTVLKTLALLLGVFLLLGAFWLSAHYRGSVPPSPWPPRVEHVNPADNAYPLTQERVDDPLTFNELLDAPLNDHARIFREDEITFDRALRETSAARAEMDALPRFVITGDVPAALTLWRHRTVSVLVQVDGERAVAEARALWRHSVDAAEHCDTLVACMLGVVLVEHAMLAAESTSARFDASEVPALNELRSEVTSAFHPRPSLKRAIEGEYHFMRDAVEDTACFSFDRAQTEAIFREYYEAMHAFAEAFASVEETTSPEGLSLIAGVDAYRAGPKEEFSSFYNLCGGELADVLWLDLAEHIEDHRAKFDHLARRQHAFR